MVTGAGSLIGRSLLYRLVSLGFSVRGFDVAEIDDPIDEVEYVFGDVNRRSILSEISKEVDCVFHLIGATPKRAKKSGTSSSSHLATTITLANIALSHKVVAFVYLSSAEVYGVPKGVFIGEDEKRRPVTVAGREHALVEDYLINTISPRGLRVIILRSAPVTGWDVSQKTHPSLSLAFKNIMMQKQVYLVSNGRYLVQYIDTEDLASAMVRSIRIEGEGHLVLNVAAHDVVTQRELAAALIERFGPRSKIIDLGGSALPFIRFLNRIGRAPIGTDYHQRFSPQLLMDAVRANELLEITSKRIVESVSEMFSSWLAASADKGKASREDDFPVNRGEYFGD